ncbi:galanin peptides preproprotein [Camelus ferus]|nr:galanin peptides preproprotein [Camelus ferus]
MWPGWGASCRAGGCRLGSLQDSWAPRKMMALEMEKEKRGWTLNSAGYLLGPHAIDNHRSFQDKHGLAGKRELHPDDETRPEAGALERLPGLPAALSSEDMEQS